MELSHNNETTGNYFTLSHWPNLKSDSWREWPLCSLTDKAQQNVEEMYKTKQTWSVLFMRGYVQEQHCRMMFCSWVYKLFLIKNIFCHFKRLNSGGFLDVNDRLSLLVYAKLAIFVHWFAHNTQKSSRSWC